jgi:hypothetical protein
MIGVRLSTVQSDEFTRGLLEYKNLDFDDFDVSPASERGHVTIMEFCRFTNTELEDVREFLK